MRRILLWLRNLTLVIASLVFLVGLLEIATRVFSDLPPRLLQRSSVIGGAYIPNTKINLIGPESNQEVEFRTNREGFRGQNRPYDKPKNTFRIAVLGDSQMAAVNTAEDHIFTSLLEKQLAAKYPQHNWEIHNFSVSGASTGQELNLYKEVVKNYEPDLVICAYYNGNDFSDNSSELSSNPRIYLTPNPNGELEIRRPGNTGGVLSWLKLNSRFYNWQKLTVRKARRKAIDLGWLGKANRVRGGLLGFIDPRDDKKLTDAWDLNDRLLKLFQDEVEMDNATFLLVSIPHSLEFDNFVYDQVNGKLSAAGYGDRFLAAQVETRLRKVARLHNINAIFLNDLYSQTLNHRRIGSEDFHLTYLNGLGHINEHGHKLMSEAVGNVIRVSQSPNPALVIAQ